MREAGGTEHGGVELVLLQGMPIPPGVVILASPEVPRNVEGAEPRPVTVESQESVQRPWWRRMFGR
jgi:hypothetical protein